MKRLSWHTWLDRYLAAIAEKGITPHILFTCSPFGLYEGGVSWQELAEHTVRLFENETMTSGERIEAFYNYRINNETKNN